MKIHTIVLLLLVLACVFSCTIIRRAVIVGGATVVGGVAGGPPGAAAGAIASDIAMDKFEENVELRNGALKGEESYVKDLERRETQHVAEIARLQKVMANRPVIEVEKPFIPTWVWWQLGGVILLIVWLKGHHILDFLKGGGVKKLLNIFLPSWLQP